MTEVAMATRKCNACNRAAIPNFAVCERCLIELLHAFGEKPATWPQSWHDRARLGVGRESIVGGLPREPLAA